MGLSRTAIRIRFREKKKKEEQDLVKELEKME